MSTPRRDVMRLGGLGILSTALPTAAAASSDVVVPSSAVTYLSNVGQARTGETSSLERTNSRHLQRCVAGETAEVNVGTLVFDAAAPPTRPARARLQLFEDVAGAAGDEIGRLNYVSHDASTGVVICANATPVVVPAGPFWVETYYSDTPSASFHRISGTSSTGRAGWSITDQVRFPGLADYGTISYALEFSLGYEP